MKPRPSFPANLNGAGVKPKPALGRPALQPAVGSPSRKTPALRTPPVSMGLGLDSSAVRAQMVAKLAAQGVQDSLVLQAMGRVERHRFVESALAGQAYEDTSLPIGFEQTISKPNVVARMIELLRQDAQGQLGRILEIGTGCGYQAAVLSHVATEVYSIERLRGLHEKAKKNLLPFRLPNVHLIFGDGMLGFPKGAPYAGIISAAGGENVPQAWLDQLATGGRLVAPTVTASGHQALVVIHKTSQGFDRQVLEAVHFVPLKSGIA
jgi:protein-L-isoaspartate(D-aspartate) O-methyltransferase